MPFVTMDEEDYPAYTTYCALPSPIRKAIRAIVFMCRSDQWMVRRVVLSLQPASSEPEPGAAASAPCVRGRVRSDGSRRSKPSQWRLLKGGRRAHAA